MPVYLITWTTYGTWLPGDDRGSVTRNTNRYGSPIDSPFPARAKHVRGTLVDTPFTMGHAERTVVHDTIHAHFQRRGWRLLAINVRTNHVHLVGSAEVRPEKIMGECKAWASRRLRERLGNRKIWTRHGSTRWLRSAYSIDRAIQYVLYEQ